MTLRVTVMLLVLVVVVLGACRRNQPDPNAFPTPSALPSYSFEPIPSPIPSVSPSPSPTVTRSATPKPPSIPEALRGQDITKIATIRKVVALTFDAGANADGAASILGTLEREGIPATFFLTGDFAKRFPETTRLLRGYRIGNHSATHPHMPALSDAAFRKEVLDAEAAIRAATGADPRPWFRFPYGDRTARTIEKVNSLGYVPVRWTVDSLGWQGTSKHTAASVAARVLDTATPGQIILMHMGSNPEDHSILDADALPAIIEGLRARGYAFVTLDALLAV